MQAIALCMNWIPDSAALCHHDANKVDEESQSELCFQSLVKQIWYLINLVYYLQEGASSCSPQV